MAWVHSDVLGQGPMEIGTVDADPTAGAGLAAAVGSIAYLNTGGGAWRKSDAADTGWTDLGLIHRAAAAPTVAADDDHGFEIGSQWTDTTVPATTYVCHDNATGAAVWLELSGQHVDATPAFPGVNDDDAAGFHVGDVWVVDGGGGTTLRLECKDNATGAAVWQLVAGSIAAGYPDANDDETEGNLAGTARFDTTNMGLHICSDGTATAAVWHQVGAYGDRDFCCNGSFRATYDFATHGGVVGANVFGPFLPDNAYIIDAWYEVATTFTSPTGPDNATIAMGHADDAPGLIAAVAINDVGNPWDAAAGPIVTLADRTVANFTTKTTARRQLALTVGVEDITAGRLTVFGTYGVAE